MRVAHVWPAILLLYVPLPPVLGCVGLYIVQQLQPFSRVRVLVHVHVSMLPKMAAGEDVKLTINEEYAKKYEQKKRVEELSKRETTLHSIFVPSLIFFRRLGA